MQYLESVACAYEDLYQTFLLHCPTEYKTCKKSAFSLRKVSLEATSSNYHHVTLLPDVHFLEQLWKEPIYSHLPGRPLRINLMSRYICFSQNGRFDVSFEELFSKVQNPGGFFRKIVFWGFFL